MDHSVTFYVAFCGSELVSYLLLLLVYAKTGQF
jgi:uncharacterized membrane protein